MVEVAEGGCKDVSGFVEMLQELATWAYRDPCPVLAIKMFGLGEEVAAWTLKLEDKWIIIIERIIDVDAGSSLVRVSLGCQSKEGIVAQDKAEVLRRGSR